MAAPRAKQPAIKLPKCPTGIKGIDEITGGGLPRGRPTLVCGGAGSGKTLFAMEFLVRGVLQYNEPGIFVSFEESDRDLAQNVISLGWDLDKLVRQKKMLVDYVYVERSEIEETGEYDLEGLFIRLGNAIDSISAKRIVLDTPEVLFSGFANQSILRAEFHRLFHWLKDKGVTAVVTAEPGDRTMTRFGIEEYVSDCVISLDHRVTEQIATRRLRIVKYRGSSYSTNEYPFLIGEAGFLVLPITSLGLDYEVSTERVSTGIPRLDAMLGGKGYHRGSSILVSSTAGAGKTSVAAAFASAACQRGERCLYFCFEEPQSQIMRNMRSIGIDLEPWVKSGLLQFDAARVSSFGLETHLVKMQHGIGEFKPQFVIVDPISNLTSVASAADAKSMLTLFIDHIKSNQITALFTNLSRAGGGLETTEAEISSLMDTWLLLRDIESGGERNRSLYVLKSRGMAHSNQMREFLLTDKGIKLLDVYVGPSGVFTGTARVTREAEEKAAVLALQEETERMECELNRKRKTMEAQLAAIRADFETEEDRLKKGFAEAKMRKKVLIEDRARMGQMRGEDEDRA